MCSRRRSAFWDTCHHLDKRSRNDPDDDGTYSTGSTIIYDQQNSQLSSLVYTLSSQRVDVSADVGSADMASFTRGVFGRSDQIPSLSNVFGWYAYVDSDTHLHINVLYREFDPKKPGMGPEFDATKFTIVSEIRRIFNVAAQVSVEKLVRQYNNRVQKLIERLVSERNERNSEAFRDLFKEISSDAQEGGHVLFEPFERQRMDPPLNIEGNTFPNQGIRSAKRIRLMAELDDGKLVSVHLLPSSRDVAPGIQLGSGARAFASPWTDVRLLAGSLALGNPMLYELLLSFVNMLVPTVKFITTNNPNTGDAFIVDANPGATGLSPPTENNGPDFNIITTAGGVTASNFSNDAAIATFPTIFTYKDVQDIHEMLTREDIPLAHLPFYGDRVVQRINAIIKDRISKTERIVNIRPMKYLFELDRRIVAAVASNHGNVNAYNRIDRTAHHYLYLNSRGIRQAAAGANPLTYPQSNEWDNHGYYTPTDNQNHIQVYKDMQHSLDSLQRNPVLWINGPRLNKNQGVETEAHTDATPAKLRAWIDTMDDDDFSGSRFRPSILPGFDPNELKSYAHNAGAGMSGAYQLTRNATYVDGQATNHLFSTDCTLNSGIDGEARLGGQRRQLQNGIDPMFMDDRTVPRANYNDFGDPMSNVMDSINTIYNIMSTPGVAVRLKDWQKAFGINDTVEFEPEQSDADDMLSSIAEPPYHTEITQTANDRRFRLSMMDPPRVTDANVQEDEIDFDREYQQFEYDKHVGDIQSYADEIMTVVRLALECIVIESSDVAPTHMQDLASLYRSDEANLHDRVVPLIPVPSAAADPVRLYNDSHISAGWTDNVRQSYQVRMSRTVTSTIPRVFKNKDGNFAMSACSHFVYNNIVKHAAAPLTPDVHDHVNVNKVMALLGSLSPFPLTNAYARAFIQQVLVLCKQRLDTMLQPGRSYHLVQHMEHNRAAEVQQDYEPIIVHFERTQINGDTLKWFVGGESTWMLEGIVLAANFVNLLAQPNQPLQEVPDSRMVVPPPQPVRLSESATTNMNTALQSIRRTRFATNTIQDQNGDIIDAQQYARWLHMDASVHIHSQVGCFFFGKPNTDFRGPVGMFSAKLTGRAPEAATYYESITPLKTPGADFSYRVGLVQLAIDAATTDAMWAEVQNYAGKSTEDVVQTLWTNNTDFNDNGPLELPDRAKTLAVVGMTWGLAYYIWSQVVQQNNGLVQLAQPFNPRNNGLSRNTFGELQMANHIINWATMHVGNVFRGAALNPAFFNDDAVTRALRRDIGNFQNQDNLNITQDVYNRAVKISIRMFVSTVDSVDIGSVLGGDTRMIRNVGAAGWPNDISPNMPMTGYELSKEPYTIPALDADIAAADNFSVAFCIQIKHLSQGNRRRTFTFDVANDLVREVNGLHYYGGQRISLPLWTRHQDGHTSVLVGYAFFSQCIMDVDGAANPPTVSLVWNGCIMDEFLVVNDTVVTYLEESTFTFNCDVYLGLHENPADQQSNFTAFATFYRNFPVLRVGTDAESRDLSAILSTTELKFDPLEMPYRFTASQRPLPSVNGGNRRPFDSTPPENNNGTGTFDVSDLDPDMVADTLMASFEGLHFSNSRALHRTILAVAVNSNYTKINRFLAQRVQGRYMADIPWSHSTSERSGHSILLESLFHTHDISTMRATVEPLAKRVIVSCQGPGAADLVTAVHVEGYFFRSNAFYDVEVDVMSILKGIAQTTTQVPRGSVPNPIARHMDRFENIYTILDYRPQAASAMSKFMINVQNMEKVGQHSSNNPSRSALWTQTNTIERDAKHILYRV